MGTEPNETLGSRVKTLREAKGWSQTRLESESGVNQQNISNIERGKTLNPNRDVLENLSKALETTPLYLITGISSSPKITESLEDFGKTLLGNELKKLSGAMPISAEEWIGTQANLTDEKFRILKIDDDSMNLRLGDMVVLDTSITTYTGPGIYALLVDEIPVIRRMQVTLGGDILIMCDNKAYTDERFNPQNFPFKILGKVTGIFSFKSI